MKPTVRGCTRCIRFIRALFTTIACAGATQRLEAQVSDAHPAGYTLVFGDEFDGLSLDRTKWCTRYIYGGGPELQVADSGCVGPTGGRGTLDFLNDEQQRYVDFNSRGEAMHTVGEGKLTLRATKTRSDSYAAYESAMIRSKVEVKPTDTRSYYVTTRVSLPNVIGTWPAFWLVGGYGTNGQSQWPPEIDIFEAPVNGVDDLPHMLHMGAMVRGGAQTGSGATEVTFAESFDRAWGNHVSAGSLRERWVEVGAHWTVRDVCFFVDGTKTVCLDYRWVLDTGEPANPASVLLNLAIGGQWAGRYGIDDARFPTQMEADHVRVYASDGAPQSLPPPPAAVPASPKPALRPLYLIDSGAGIPYYDAAGRRWLQDKYFLAGTGGTVDRGEIPVARTQDARLYQTERWCLDGYDLPVSPGVYIVRSHFAETHLGVAGPGGRVFDVDVEGRVLRDVDVFREAGGRNIAITRTINNVLVKDGTLSIRFLQRTECPMIDAIEVELRAVVPPQRGSGL